MHGAVAHVPHTVLGVPLVGHPARFKLSRACRAGRGRGVLASCEHAVVVTLQLRAHRAFLASRRYVHSAAVASGISTGIPYLQPHGACGLRSLQLDGIRLLIIGVVGLGGAGAAAFAPRALWGVADPNLQAPTRVRACGGEARLLAGRCHHHLTRGRCDARRAAPPPPSAEKSPCGLLLLLLAAAV